MADPTERYLQSLANSMLSIDRTLKQLEKAVEHQNRILIEGFRLMNPQEGEKTDG